MAEQSDKENSGKKVENFLQQFRDKSTRDWNNFTAEQFMDVWNHYDTDGNGYIEGEEFEKFLREFISSVVPQDIGAEVISDTALQDLTEDFMLAYDENEDNRIEIGELAQMLPTDETFLLLFQRDNPLKSSVDFMNIWKQFDTDNSGYIESEELEKFLKYLLKDAGVQLPDEKIAEYACTILQLFDRNGDGKLQLSEMSRLLPVKENYLLRLFKNVRNITDNEIDRIFGKYDTDHNGFIEGTELEGFLKDVLDPSKEDYDDAEFANYKEVLMKEWGLDSDVKMGPDQLKKIILEHKRKAEEDEISGIHAEEDDDNDNDY